MDQLRDKLRNPIMALPVAQLRASAGSLTNGATLPRAVDTARSCALLSVLEDNEQLGRKAISILLERLPNAKWDVSAQDISREIGFMMVSAGMVYDWCFRWLDDNGPTIIGEIYRLAAMLETGYPPNAQGAVTGHGGEAMLFRDLLGAGLAIYHESPEMYRLSATRILNEFVPARNFFYPAGVHHQGSAYGPYRYRWEVCAAWIFQRAGLGNPFSPAQVNVPYRWIYMERPDGRQMADADVFGGRPATPAYLLAANLYGDRYIQDRFIASADTASQDPVEILAFFNPDLRPASVSELPLARYFDSPFSGMVVRTAWNARDNDPAIAEFKVKEWQFNNHQHLDAGAFQIWYRGPLAMDTGLYRTYFSPHDGNYLKRTVAHNCVLLVDPAEGPVAGRWAPDGGQRWPNNAREARSPQEIQERGYHVARTLGQQTGWQEARAEWTVLEGDLSAAYEPTKATLHRRAFVCLTDPWEGVKLAFAVFDHVRPAKTGLSVRWLLHTASEPAILDSGTRSSNGRATLTHQLLQPASGATIHAVGGAGQEFTSGGQNYAADKTPTAADEAGAWRVEVRAAEGETGVVFLNLLLVTAADSTAPPAAVTLSSKTHTGLLVRDRVMLFGLDAARLREPVEFTLPDGAEAYRCLVMGLAAGEWKLGETNVAVTAEGGVAAFTAPPGPVVLSPPA